MGWLSTMGACEINAEAKFHAVGAACARRPWLTLAVNFLITIICGMGFLNIVVETKGDRLWVDQESVLKGQMTYIEETYAVQPRISFLTVASNPMGGDALAAAPMALLTTVHDQIMALETKDGFSWADVCSRDAFGRCRATGTIAFFSTLANGVDTAVLAADPTTTAIKARMAKPTSPGTPWATPQHEPVVDDQYFMGWDEATTSAQGARSYYFLKGQFEGRCTLEGLTGDACDDNAKESVQKDLEELMIELLEPYMLHDKLGEEQSPTGDALIYLQAFRSLDDELLRAVGGDITLFALTINIMCIFCCVVLGKTCGGHCMSSRFLLANGGIGLVMFSMIAGYGLSAGIGYEFTQLQQILPFILIGIGVDDMVIITAAFDRVTKDHPNMSVEERVGKAYARCGLSITLTSSTDVIAFVLGSLSKLPAIKVFCIYAAFAILFTFSFMCTGFAGMLALDTRRMEGNRFDCLPCITSKTAADRPKAEPADNGLQKCFASYSKFLLQMPVKIVVLAVFGSMLAVNSWGWTQTTSGFDLVDLTPDESYVRDFVNLNTELLGSPSGKVPFNIYTQEMDYHTADVQTKYEALHDALAASDRVESVNSWYLNFKASLAATSTPMPTTAATFYPAVQSWLNAETALSSGIRINQRFSREIVWVNAACSTCADASACSATCSAGIKASRFSAEHPIAVSSTSEEQVKCLEAMEAIQEASTLEPKPFIWTFFYLFFVSTQASTTYCCLIL